MLGEGGVLGVDLAESWAGLRLAAFAGELLATPGKICCLKRDGVVSHSVGRHGGDTWRGHVV